MDDDAVTVSMPYWRCAGHVRAAVTAVLEQTHSNLRLVVVNDGDARTPPWPELDDIDDPRLVRAELPANRGRYYCDAVVLAACETPWFAIHDADDLAHPQWIAELMAACEANGWAAAFAPQRVVSTNGRAHTEPTALEAAGGLRMAHLAHHAAVYRTAALRAVGGPHPGYRIGYDTLMVNLMAMHWPVGTVDRPLYRRIGRAGSLTRHPHTGQRSPHRRAVRADLERLYAQARAADPGAVITAAIGPGLAAAVKIDAGRLTAGALAPAVALGPRPPSSAVTEDLWGPWQLDVHTAHELAATLHRRQPKMVVECGSGASTLIMGEYARASGATVVSLEHEPRFLARTAELLAGRGLAGHVDLRLAPLGKISTPRGPQPWYSTDMLAGVEFALVDGPPGAVGRQGALYALAPHLTGDWVVWLDDADRGPEQAALAAWREDLGVHYEEVPLPRGLAVITAQPPPPLPVDASDVAVTVLTGRRPVMLAATVVALAQAAPGLLDSAHVAVFHNGDDPATAELLAGWAGWINVHIARAPGSGPLTHGPAAATVIEAGLAGRRPYLLHLEDDWAACTTVPGWLDAARNALEDDSIGVVRLRHRGDKVLRRNMVSGQDIEWLPRPWLPAGVTVARAHYTLNPTLMRAEDVALVWPADDEKHAMRRFHDTGLTAAQLDPGVFRHIGGQASLHPGRSWPA